ncbi:SRPBCC family protein [Streptomyces sp. NA02950]|uniref:aromatase/cyclase n=1 Tax=Streptomyces sp. NA02950 TaxID=2742137 RepID=UPI00158FCAA0|nr:aromatase/cyclase [Streptomyces sp. NA02950]QKV93073.1 SRPBCC family protein [Streptomyces sp. NA02950]
MSESASREVEHEITINASAHTVYGLLEDVTSWPHVFPPTIHVERLESEGRSQRIRIWATARGEAKTWTSRRALDPEARRITFRQESSAPPVATMGGAWVIEPLAANACRVRLLHDYRSLGNSPEGLAWIDKAVDHNSRSELAALRDSAERASHSRELFLTFDDTVYIDGSAEDVYDFLNEADRWRDRLPHVDRVELREDHPGLQVLTMDTLTKDGSRHTTESVRVCFPHARIVYKQTRVPPLMTVHTGQWALVEEPGGLAVISRHTVVLNPDTIRQLLGETAVVADARKFIRNALSANSLATLEHAKEYAEGKA